MVGRSEQTDKGHNVIGPTRTVIMFIIVSSFLPVTAQTQRGPSKNTFMLRVIKVDRKGDGCTVDAQSNKRTYKLSSDIPAACAMLEAGEDYKAMRVTVGNDP